jgi:hypothetical protein
MIIIKQQSLLKHLKERKMKAMIYNLQKVMMTAILVLTISSVGSAATKNRETSTLTNHNNSEAYIANSEANSSNGGLLSETAVEAGLKEVSQQIEDWMTNGSYWESDNSAELTEKQLAEHIESWMANGSFWSHSDRDQKSGAKLTRKIETWMDNGSFWSVDAK